MHNFCEGEFLNKIIEILNNHLLTEQVDLRGMYEKMIGDYDTSNPGNKEIYEISKHEIYGYEDLLSKKETENLGIDLPIYFGDPGSKKKIMIVAMDAKRNGQDHNNIVVGSVFALHQKDARNTNRNDYWKFIEPITRDSFVYLTDIFKLYYETHYFDKEKKYQLLSNKDKDYTDKTSVAFKTNKKILEEEIKLINPDTIISLGNESANALKMISGITSNELDTVHDGISYLFMPHISRTVTQSIPTIASLFITMGKLKNNPKMIALGEEIKSTKENLYK
jgi:hypothetical protein